MTAMQSDPNCRICRGTGIDGDCGPDGSVVDVDCGCRSPAVPLKHERVVAWRYKPTIGAHCDRWQLTEVPPWKWGTTLAIEYEPLYCLPKTERATRSSDVIAGLEMALAQAEAMIERLEGHRAILRDSAKDVIAWCDNNPPAGDALYCITRLRHAIPATE